MSEAIYCSYNAYSIRYDPDANKFEIGCKDNKKCLAEMEVYKIHFQDKEIDFSEYTTKSYSTESHASERHTMSISFERDQAPMKNVTLFCEVTPKGVKVHFQGEPEGTATFRGKAKWGKNFPQDTFAMSSKENSSNLRSAIGFATSNIDDILFDRTTDTAMKIDGGRDFRFRYNHKAEVYDFTLNTGIILGERSFSVSRVDDIMAKQYDIDYAPINKNVVFSKPPAGWMTWYAVQFDACEDVVLENARWQSENLKKFGADALWIDWEWYHKDYHGYREDGVCCMKPDPVKYPHGLDWLADQIKKLGFEPALWIGFTNDPDMPDYVKENPEIILKKIETWVGTYYYDITHPKYLNEFLPMACKKVKEWGYKAIKYDTLPDIISMHDRNHELAYDTDLTTQEAFRQMIKATRDAFGDDVYMLSCAGRPQTVLWASDIFDAARVGADIFDWDEFIRAGIMKVMKYYPLHNMSFYADPDNVILGERYNTYNQAASRIYIVSMLGLPMTFGDVFKNLPDDRVELIRRCLPVQDIHPMDTKNHIHDGRVLAINLNIEKPYESYNVVDIFNMQHEKCEYETRLGADLYLDEGYYHLYDYTKQEYLGISDAKIALALEPYESRVIAVRKKLDRPQIVSTSRHVTQGAAEIESLEWCDAEKVLKFRAEVVEGDEYRVTVYVPEGFEPRCVAGLEEVSRDGKIYVYSFTPEANQVYNFEIGF